MKFSDLLICIVASGIIGLVLALGIVDVISWYYVSLWVVGLSAVIVFKFKKLCDELDKL